MEGDPYPLGVDLVLIACLVLVNGFFAAAETAMVKVRSARIDSLVQEGSRRASFASHVSGHIEAYLTVCKLGTMLASLGLGWMAGAAVAARFEPVFASWNVAGWFVEPLSFLIGFSLVVILLFVIGELVPKSVSVRKSESVALWTAGPVILFRRLLSPVIRLTDGIADLLLKPFGLNTSETSPAHSEEEIRDLVKESHKSGLIDQTELALVDNIFEFAETNAREIMIPRTEMICLNGNLSFAENKAIALEEMHTRYPVCENDKDNILGFIHIKDLLKVSDGAAPDIRELMRPITSVPESMPISALLKLMQKKKTQIAILIDEYGGTAGLVTLEDIMEEIVGEIQDEFDEERPDVEKRDESTYSINGLMLIEEVNGLLGLDIPSDDYDTIGGWMYSRIEIPPKKNQVVDSDDGRIRFVIEETDHLRISRIMVTRLNELEWMPQAETG